MLQELMSACDSSFSSTFPLDFLLPSALNKRSIERPVPKKVIEIEDKIDRQHENLLSTKYADT